MVKWARRLLAAVVPLLAAAAPGCASINTLQTADTLGAGRSQFAVEPGFERLGFQGKAVSVPRIDFAYRYGVTDTTDIGGRAGVSGLEFGAKFLLTHPSERSVVLSLAPSIGGMAVGGNGNSAGVVNIALPLLIGLGMTESGSHLVLGPRLVQMVAFGGTGKTSTTLKGLLAGATVGYAARFGALTVIPEFGALYPVSTSGSVTVDNRTFVAHDAFGSGVLYQVALGFLFAR